MSFIDLMANDVWSDADIKARLHAEIRSEVSEQSEAELNRALQGKMLGMHTMTPGEMALLMLFKGATDRVAVLGAAARADMALLAATLPVEAAQRRLAQPVVLPLEAGEPPVPINLEAVALDTQEREAAQAVVDGASAEALALALLRNPAPKPQEVAE